MSGNRPIGPDDVNVILKFGGGLHTSASPDEIDPRESAGGQNFLIDIQNRNLRNRPPFDLIGRVPNGSSVNGGGSLLKSDGTVSTLFQAGGVVYSWDGQTTFTSVGTCNAASKLRGHWRSHNFTLDNKVLFTDLSLVDTVKEWDGTTFATTVFTNEAGSGFGNFFARYLNVSNERAIWSNVKDPSATSPHMMVGSKLSDYTVITINNTPSSALADADPFYLLSPDLRPINAHITAFGGAMVSTEKGQLFNLTGSSAKDFAFAPFFPNSAATGQEAMTVIGNDILYGRQGRIESVIATNTFGNSAAADLSAMISDQIYSYSGWTVVFNSRTRKCYAFPTGKSEVWVMDTAIRDAGQLSPWMRWTTQDSMAFQPTFVMSMLDPLDGLEYIFMGAADGDIYRMEGTGSVGDGHGNNTIVQFLSKLFPAKLDSQVYDIEGYVKYAKGDPATVTLTFQYQGKEAFNKQITVDLPQTSVGFYYGDNAYYNGDFYYGTITGRLQRQAIYPPGDGNEFQVLVEISGTTDVSINEIGLRLRSASN